MKNIMRGTLRWVVGWFATLAVVATVLYVVLALLPGDAASRKLGMDATPEALARLRHDYGLDQPLAQRWASWAGGILFHGDFGTVHGTGRQVIDQVSVAMSRTALVMALSLVGIMVLGVGLGVLAGIHAGSPLDRTARTAALLVLCTPEFVLGTGLALVFSARLKMLPAVSLVPVNGTVLDRPEVLVLPVLTVSLLGSAMLLRQVRAVVVRQSEAPHVEAARLAGLSGSRVLWRHLMPGVWGPVLQATAAVVPYLLGGAVVVEQVFGFPGLGSLLVDAVTAREPDLLMACIVIVVGVSLAVYRLADVVASSRSGSPSRDHAPVTGGLSRPGNRTLSRDAVRRGRVSA
ncbi:Glutathione transport system permease protein GsiC [Corynebacterium provencense]|uniref:Glutathione transport system permease protein GsiC n=1 Tax=Corynebacterium provencense TaxID=1737425 RepID=A0A2Z3YN58_9CORY|nr:Glutathione transport system permease protein GsiC [Corynebacterium provencense]